VTLAKEYANRLLQPSDIQGHLHRFVDMVDELQARHVIELGTRTGVSTVAWLYALEHTGGRLTSVDLDPQPDIGDWPHWTFIQGDDLDPRIASSLDQADIVFIDTSHLYEHTVAELHVYQHLVRPGGRIVCHDTQLAHPEGAPAFPRFPVRKAVLEFCDEQNLMLDEYEDSWGLAVIHV
jgi:cephalosporin hydroxylase